ncbi:hypothetical protein [Streptomyces sp. NRRL F-5053]|uniref:hypothetical protein n=1 Tax=Streptomyces sp. NRRL F-5053 TaxID=1463854 RepID=UPI002D21BE8A|nr:hypothetical protein [Streptomyces sp. NRRL F-5053]
MVLPADEPLGLLLPEVLELLGGRPRRRCPADAWTGHGAGGVADPGPYLAGVRSAGRCRPAAGA